MSDKLVTCLWFDKGECGKAGHFYKRAECAIDAMMTMVEIDIAALDAAVEGVAG